MCVLNFQLTGEKEGSMLIFSACRQPVVLIVLQVFKELPINQPKALLAYYGFLGSRKYII